MGALLFFSFCFSVFSTFFTTMSTFTARKTAQVNLPFSPQVLRQTQPGEQCAFIWQMISRSRFPNECWFYFSLKIVKLEIYSSRK